jgi:PTS system N-acetylglucosamine-specific IIC component
MDKIMEPLQRLGKALMGAVAVMPLAALMMGIGYWISSVGGDNTVIFGDLLLKTGAAVLDNLGVIFAIAIAYGLSRDNSGAAALAGFVGFATLVNLIGPEAIAGYRGIEPTELTGDEALRWAESGWDAIGYGNVPLRHHDRYSRRVDL